MRTSWKLLPLLFLTACATVTAQPDQSIAVSTEPSGAHCRLVNAVNSWNIESTPATVHVRRSYSPLEISCSKGNRSGKTELPPYTRGRAYGNILLLGIPAIVDAGTGNGYEYRPDSAHLILQTK